jgi:hypothetical protein
MRSYSLGFSMFIELLHRLHMGFPFLVCRLFRAVGPAAALHLSISAFACSVSAGLSLRALARSTDTKGVAKHPNTDPSREAGSREQGSFPRTDGVR